MKLNLDAKTNEERKVKAYLRSEQVSAGHCRHAARRLL